VRIFDSPAALGAAVGEHLGHSAWQEIDQARVDAFADATGDHQWIHVDPERARSGPFGTTIAHGFLTLSLLPMLVAQVYRVDGVRMAINYGLNKVRFPAPLPVGSRVRAGLLLQSIDSVPAPDGGPDALQLINVVTVEADGSPKPCCVAETVTRLYL
jgi:acyl dehydratase